jgi:hypothetical protein
MRFVLFVWIVVAASPAVASVYEIDLYAGGDALVTRDTDLGIDWLDVTLTRTTSPTEVMEGAGGWLDEGWRLATMVEVCSFFGRVSGYPLTCPGTTYEPGDFGQPILDLLGGGVASS